MRKKERKKGRREGKVIIEERRSRSRRDKSRSERTDEIVRKGGIE